MDFCPTAEETGFLGAAQRGKGGDDDTSLIMESWRDMFGLSTESNSAAAAYQNR